MENYNRFDELIRQKLDSYEAEPDMDLLVNIHARKNRFLKSRNLLTIIALLAILMAGIIGGYLVKNAKNKDSQDQDHTATSGFINNDHGRALSSDNKGYNSLSESNRLIFNGEQGSQFAAINSGNKTAYRNNTILNNNSGKNTVQPLLNNVSSKNTNKNALKYTLDKTLSDVVITANRSSADNPAKDGSVSENTEKEKNGQDDDKKDKENNKQQADNCSVSFDYYAGYSNSLSFISDVAQGVSVKWQFGDGETSTERNPKHTYLKSGQYAVTLTAINTATKCKAEVYKLVLITKGVQYTSSTIKGSVFADAELASKTMVQLIDYNSRFNTGKVIQTTYTNSKGNYEFTEVTAGNYIVQAGSYKSYSSTFYGNVTVSEAASNISVFKDDYDVLTGYDIQLINGRNGSSNAFNEADSNPGVKTVIVFDSNNKPVATVTVNADGKVIASSADLPSGDYMLVDPDSGASKGKMSVDNEGRKSLNGGESMGGEGLSPKQEVRLSPNPASNNVKVGLTNAVSSPAEVTIINYAGSVVKQFTIPDGSALNSVDINSLSGGMYYVIVKQNGVSATSTLIKSSDNSK